MVRRSIGLLMISGLLPVVALGGAFGVISLRSERDAVRRDADATARFTAALASAKLVDAMRAVNMIAQSPAFDGPLDTKRFRTLAERLREGEPSWRTLSVADVSGHRLLDVPSPIGGTVSGPVVDRASLDETFRSGRPVVGNVVRGAQGRLAFAIRAPAIRDGVVRYAVSAIVAPQTLLPLLRLRPLRPGWRVAIVDGAGDVVASSAAGSSVVGHRMSAVGMRSLQSGKPEFYDFNRHDGTLAIGTWEPIEGTGWTIHVSAPAIAYSGPAARAVALLIGVGVACLLLLAVLVRLLSAELRQYRALEVAEIQRQRMEALGRLTGGVAHDFNNLLTPILGGLDMIRRRMAGDDSTLRYVDSAIASAERAQALVSRLLSFSRRQTLSATSIDVREMLDGIGELLTQAVGPAGTLSVEVAPGAHTVMADRNQLELAILNLVINARDAMPDGGTVRVTATSLPPADTADLTPGDYVAIAVADEGSGMDEATMRQAIDPFFTTKSVDKGTGLGLSMVHGFAAQSGGVLQLRSRVGEGTTATIVLPRADAAPIGKRQTSEKLVVASGSILLVDDQESVRSATAEMLREAGYAVTEESSVDAALDALKVGRFDAIVTDYVMPGRTGADLIRAVRAETPDMPILLVTGYADAARDVPQDVPKLTKPYRSAELLEQMALIGLPERS